MSTKSKTNEKPLTTREQTAITTRQIIDFLWDEEGILVTRNNVLPVPVVRNGAHVGYRPGSTSGRPDIEGILPLVRWIIGVPLLIEIKTGKDKLSDIQVAYLSQASAAGGVALVVKDFDDFKKKWRNVRQRFHSLGFPLTYPQKTPIIP
jgi:hypothetical protein